MKKYLWLAALLLGGSNAMGVVRQQENVETPSPLQSVKAQFFKKGNFPYTIKKFRGPISRDERFLADDYASELLRVLPGKIEDALQQELSKKQVTTGPEYLIAITLDKMEIKLQDHGFPFGDGVFTPSVERIWYQASVYKNETKKVFWRAIFDLSDFGKIQMDIPTTGDEIAIEVVKEMAKAGWIK